MSSSGLVGRVVKTCIRRERFIKAHKHRGPKTGKDDRIGSFWREDLRSASRYGYLSEDGSMFIENSLMVPKLVVPNLTKFNLRAFVSSEIDSKEFDSDEPIQYLDTISLSTGSFK